MNKVKRNWPHEGKKDDTPYHQLNLQMKARVTKHLMLSGMIEKYEGIRKHFIRSFHQKKSYQDEEELFLPRTASDEVVYSNVFFQGKEGLVNGGYTTLLFRGVLDGEVMKTCPKSFDYTQVYYNHRNKPEHLQFSSFNKEEWEFSDHPTLTAEDHVLVNRYKTEFLAVLELGIDLAHDKCEKDSLIKERDELIKIFETTSVVEDSG